MDPPLGPDRSIRSRTLDEMHSAGPDVDEEGPGRVVGADRVMIGDDDEVEIRARRRVLSQHPHGRAGHRAGTLERVVGGEARCATRSRSTSSSATRCRLKRSFAGSGLCSHGLESGAPDLARCRPLNRTSNPRFSSWAPSYSVMSGGMTDMMGKSSIGSLRSARLNLSPVSSG